MNPPRALRCECGYDFPSGLLTGSYIAGPHDFVADAEGITQRYDAMIVAHRWGALMIDAIVSVVVALPVYLALGSRLAGFALASAVQLAYFFVLEGRWGVTPGKLALGIQVVDRVGGIPGFRRALVRTVLRLLEVNPVILVCLPAGVIVLLSRSRQRFGDMLAGTYVLYAQDVARLRES